ncbi:MAG: hypothetical protein ACTHNU_15085 [Gaiellales bacterium]
MAEYLENVLLMTVMLAAAVACIGLAGTGLLVGAQISRRAGRHG